MKPGIRRHRGKTQKEGQPLWAVPLSNPLSRRGRGSLVEAPPEPVLHAGGERTPRTPGPLEPRPAGRRHRLTRDPGTGDGEHRTAEHHDETDDRQDREAADHGGGDRHPRHQHRQTDDEQRRTLQPAAGRRGAQGATANARSELGVLGIERALDLFEHALLMIGEWHSSLPVSPRPLVSAWWSPAQRRALYSHDTRSLWAVPPTSLSRSARGTETTRNVHMVQTPLCR